MFINLYLLSSFWILGHALSELPWPEWSAVERHLPRVCFTPTPETLTLAQNQAVTCVWSHPGQYPPQEAYYHHGSNRCCFWDTRTEPGIFWAIGESVMSRVTEFGIDHESSEMDRLQYFDLHPAELMDVQTLDASNDAPVCGARVTMADASVHFVSFSRLTDEDGYAVLPVIPDVPNVVTIRADRYLVPQPFQLVYSKQAEETAEIPEGLTHIVELDPGIEVRGTVVSPDGRRVEGARLHIEIERSDIPGAFWSSDLDLPRTIEDFATPLGGWVPVRSSYSTSSEGVFAIQTLPRGKMSIFASHNAYPPSDRIFVDTSDAAQISPVQISLKSPKRAYIRVEDEHQVAVPADLTVIDDVTGHEIGVWKTSSSGSVEIKQLPERTRFQVISDTHAFLQQTYDIADNAEITLVLSPLSEQNPKFRVLDTNRLPIERATISLADAELQKKYPLCLGKTDKQGTVQLESCPSQFWISIFHPDFAHQMVQFDKSNEEMQILLSAGRDIRIDMLEAKTQAPVTGVECELETSFAESTGQVYRESFAAKGHQLILHHRPELPHRLTCTSPANAVQTMSFMPASAPEKILFPYTVSRQILVLDAFSSTVPYARLEMDGRIYETDETGHLTLAVPPQTKIKIMHWLHGHTEITWTENHDLLEIRLPDTPPENVIQCLKKHGIEPVVDSAAILINHDLTSLGLKRADAVETCGQRALTIVRDGRRMVVQMP